MMASPSVTFAFASNAHDTFSDSAQLDLVVASANGVVGGTGSILMGFTTSGVPAGSSTLKIGHTAVNVNGDLFLASGLSNVSGVTFAKTLCGATLTGCTVPYTNLSGTPPAAQWPCWGSNGSKMYVSSNVGFGTATPSCAVDVNGATLLRCNASVGLGTNNVASSNMLHVADFDGTYSAAPYGLVQLTHCSTGIAGRCNAASLACVLSAAGTGTGSNNSTATGLGYAKANGGDTMFGFGAVSNPSAADFAPTYVSIDTVTGFVGINTLAPAYPLDVTGTIRATGDVTAFSDLRFKKDILPIHDALDKVLAIKGCTFRTLEDELAGVDRRHAGVVAQDVRGAMPELVHGDDSTGLSVAYGNMAALFVEAIRTLDRRAADAEARVRTLEAAMAGAANTNDDRA